MGDLDRPEAAPLSPKWDMQVSCVCPIVSGGPMAVPECQIHAGPFGRAAVTLRSQLADARHEIDLLRGQAADLNQRLDLALIDLGRALRERDEARARVEHRYPTRDAYSAACAALRKHRERADQAEAERDRRSDELRRHQQARSRLEHLLSDPAEVILAESIRTTGTGAVWPAIHAEEVRRALAAIDAPP